MCYLHKSFQKRVNIEPGYPVVQNAVFISERHTQDPSILRSFQLLNPLVTFRSICIWNETSYLDNKANSELNFGREPSLVINQLVCDIPLQFEE